MVERRSWGTRRKSWSRWVSVCTFGNMVIVCPLRGARIVRFFLETMHFILSSSLGLIEAHDDIQKPAIVHTCSGTGSAAVVVVEVVVVSESDNGSSYFSGRGFAEVERITYSHSSHLHGFLPGFRGAAGVSLHMVPEFFKLFADH